MGSPRAINEIEALLHLFLIHLGFLGHVGHQFFTKAGCASNRSEAKCEQHLSRGSIHHRRRIEQPDGTSLHQDHRSFKHGAISRARAIAHIAEQYQRCETRNIHDLRRPSSVVAEKP